MKAPIYVDDSGSITMMELRSKARRLKAREPSLGLVVVDYLQLMTSGATVENRVQEVSQISRQLKVLARDLDVPILALSQLSRAVEQRHDKRPILSDLRESGCLAGESRVFLPDEGVYRPIRTLVGRTGFRVLALDQRTWQLEPRTVTNAFATGRKPVLKLRTRLGREIRATANHKFLAVAGWRRLDTITPGERIAIPRRLDQIPRRLDQRMASYVSAVGERRTRACREIWSYLEGRGGVTNCHVIPREAWTVLVKPALSRNGVTARQLHSAIGTSYCGSTLYRSNIGPGRALDVAEAVASDELRALAPSDVYWDEVVAIEADGEEDVFDLTVDGLHNFVADDLCVHNSIEQDADLVAFVYRDEYYNPEESDQQGIAELILSKHRNGPTGTIKLSFLKRFAKFADLAAA
jgi:replicative DNA helicase